MMDDYGSWSAASQLLSYCVLPARLLLRPIVHSCSQTIVLPGPASVRETLGGPVTTLLSWPVCAVLACRFAESSHAPTMQAHPPPAPPMSSHSSPCTAQESCAPDRADATPRREAVFVFDLCASRTLSPLSLEPARARLASTVRRTPTTCSGKIACGPHEQHPVSCSALLLHPSSRRHPGLITVLFDPGWASFPGDGTSTCLLLYRQRLPHLQPLGSPAP
jgi:hypothetical protein